MKNFLNPLLFLSFFNFSLSQLIGSHIDSHNCVSDGGYQWCENTQSCIRPWETPCHKQITNVEFCETSNIQTCRIACQDPECPAEQCAMRIGNCCEHTCVVHPNDDTSTCRPCPPPVPCPMPEISSNCDIIEPIVDNCGCSTGCPTIDCSSSPLHHMVGEGETCGGFMPYDMVGHCSDGLECVYNMGPMVADAPGTCMIQCSTFRDSWGNCVDEECNSWNDGCNICDVNNNSLETCSEMVCYTKPTERARCIDNEETTQSFIPTDCLTWYDGCNSCSVNDGLLEACTMMYCFTTNDPRCTQYLNSDLTQGDICYRFCEDGSQTMIDRSEDCPKDTECMPTNLDMISFDSCGERANRCIPKNSGH
jgi:hypothetical protein